MRMKQSYTYTKTQMNSKRALVRVSFSSSKEKLPMILDSGSEVTILPASWMKNLNHAPKHIRTLKLKGVGDQEYELHEHSDTLNFFSQSLVPVFLTTTIRIFFSKGLDRANLGLIGMDYLTTFLDFHPQKNDFSLSFPTDLTTPKIEVKY